MKYLSARNFLLFEIIKHLSEFIKIQLIDQRGYVYAPAGFHTR